MIVKPIAAIYYKGNIKMKTLKEFKEFMKESRLMEFSIVAKLQRGNEDEYANAIIHQQTHHYNGARGCTYDVVDSGVEFYPVIDGKTLNPVLHTYKDAEYQYDTTMTFKSTLYERTHRVGDATKPNTLTLMKGNIPKASELLYKDGQIIGFKVTETPDPYANYHFVLKED